MRRSPVRSRPGRVALAIVLVVVAAAIVVLEPLPHGPVLLTLTRDHGVDSGDLPAVALLVLAAWIILV
jgi:hypothetical protein